MEESGLSTRFNTAITSYFATSLYEDALCVMSKSLRPCCICSFLEEVYRARIDFDDNSIFHSIHRDHVIDMFLDIRLKVSYDHCIGDLWYLNH